MSELGVREGQDFSLVLGGPLYQLLRRTRLSDDAMGLAHRRVIAAILITWAPLMLLAAFEGRLFGAGHAASFIEDIGFQLRFLVVAPLLVIAELVVHRRVRPVTAQFLDRGLVRPEQLERFAGAVREMVAWRNSIPAEAALVVAVYALGAPFALRRYLEMGSDGWYASPAGGLSLAGLWLLFVSLPILQFLLLRWYYRLFLWGRFLWRVSRLDLNLNALHPDKAGGLGFLGDSLNAFITIAAAHGVLVAGTLADRILFGGKSLPDFQVEVFAAAVFMLVLFAGPLTVFTPPLARVKRAGLREYGALGQGYVREFHRKWLSGAPPGEPLIGSADIQSLADLGNSYGAAEQVRIVPVRPGSLLAFVAAFLAPLLPLLLTMMSASKLIGSLVGMVF